MYNKFATENVIISFRNKLNMSIWMVICSNFQKSQFFCQLVWDLSLCYVGICTKIYIFVLKICWRWYTSILGKTFSIYSKKCLALFVINHLLLNNRNSNIYINLRMCDKLQSFLFQNKSYEYACTFAKNVTA